MFDSIDIEAIQARVDSLLKKYEESRAEKRSIEIQTQALGPPNNDNSIFITNLDPSVTKDELQDFFSVCGDIVRATPIIDPYTQKTKYAYIEFREEEAARNALRLNDRIFKGKNLEIVPKKDKIQAQQSRRTKRRRSTFRKRRH